MVRLMLTLTPIVCVLSAIAISHSLDNYMKPVFSLNKEGRNTSPPSLSFPSPSLPSPSPSLPSSLLPPSPVREMRHNNYQSRNLIGHYHFWFTRLFLLVRGWGLGMRLSLLMERIFWSTPMTTHTEWLPGVQLKHFSLTCAVLIEDCEGWWLSGCHSSVVEHWLHKPGVLGSTPNDCRSFHFPSQNI